MKLIFATRPSALARWQTQWVIQALQGIFPDLHCEEKIITTQGDTIIDKPLRKLAVRVSLRRSWSQHCFPAVHCAVHSLKDLPVENAEGLRIGSIPIRAEVRDALIARNGFSLHSLPQDAVVGTSSLRRAAQLRAARPDLRTESLRGNVDARLRKSLDGQYGAIILAGAGLTRLGLASHVTEWLPLDVMLPAPGQGALAVQCRAADESTLGLLSALDDASEKLSQPSAPS